MDLVIDREFKELIPSLAPEERAGLEKSLIEEGCRDALIVWNGVIVDGHNRYEICKEYGIEFKTIEKKFPDKDAAKVWIIENQFSRRNLPIFVRGELMLKLKPLIAAKAKENQQVFKGNQHVAIPANSPTKQIETRKELSKLAGIGSNTISRIEKIVDKAPDEVKAKLRAGEMSINEAYKKVKQIEKAEKIEAEIGKAKEAIESLAPMEGKYGVIVIDPPWQYEKRNNDITHRGRSPYPTMTTEELCKMKLPMNDDCIVWLWTTNAFMHDAFHVLDAWGLAPKTILTWVKDRMGLGDWLRGKTEHCILAVKGKPMINLTNETTVLNASTREHSRKPDEFYELVRNLCLGKRLEIFAREKREGFDIYGAESDKF